MLKYHEEIKYILYYNFITIVTDIRCKSIYFPVLTLPVLNTIFICIKTVFSRGARSTYLRKIIHLYGIN